MSVSTALGERGKWGVGKIILGAGPSMLARFAEMAMAATKYRRIAARRSIARQASSRATPPSRMCAIVVSWPWYFKTPLVAVCWPRAL